MSTPGESAQPSRYELREPLGSGGMGQVYRAFDTVLRRDVALKLLRSDLTAGSSGRARLLREARMAANLTHPNICTLHDVGEMDGRPFLTMELLSGETLRRRLMREPKVPAETAARIGRDVAAALAEAHGRGVIHRDIKPENIMLLPDGRVKVLDFGLAKAVDAAWSEEMPVEGLSEATTHAGLLPLRPQTLPMTDEMLTTPGQIIGTYHYLSPEQADAKPADARSDVFSLGVVLYEMLAGAKPFKGATAQALLAAIRADKSVPLDKASPKAPGALVDVVQRCLKKSPGERYEGGAGVQAALVAVEKQLLRRTRMLWAAGVALVATLGVVGGNVLWRGGAGHRDGGEGGVRGIRNDLRTVRRLTFNGKSGKPFFSPDGRSIAYRTVKPTGERQAMVMPASGGAPRQVSDLPGGFELLGWNVEADGVLGTRGSKPGLWEVPLLGGEPRLFLKEALMYSIDATRNRIAYVWESAGKDRKEIRERDLDSGEERTLYVSPNPLDNLLSPRWSWSGDRIAFFRAPIFGFGQTLHMLDLPGGALRTITLRGMDIAGMLVHWTPEDQFLVAGAGIGSSVALWKFPIEEGRPEQLTTSADADFAPDGDSPGGRIVFTRAQQRADIAIAEIPGGVLREPFPTMAFAGGPSFSLDGSRVYFLHAVGGPPVIISASTNGESSAALTDATKLSCETPVAINMESVAFACQEMLAEGHPSGPGWAPAKAIYSAHHNGEALQKLFEPAGLLWLTAASHDRSTLLYMAHEDARICFRAFDLTTGHDRLVMEIPESEIPMSVTPVDRGGFVALIRREPTEGKPASITFLELPVGEGAPREVSRIQVDTNQATLSRDESLLAYTTGDHDKMEIWIQDLPVSGPARQLTHFNGERHPHSFAFSPDGRRLAIERVRPEVSDIYMLDGF